MHVFKHLRRQQAKLDKDPAKQARLLLLHAVYSSWAVWCAGDLLLVAKLDKDLRSSAGCPHLHLPEALAEDVQKPPPAALPCPPIRSLSLASLRRVPAPPPA